MAWLISEHSCGCPGLRREYISDTTIEFVNNRLAQFLNWLENHGNQIFQNALDMHPALDDSWLSFYINNVIAEEQEASDNAVNQHLMALRYYYNYLANAGLSSIKDFRLSKCNMTKAIANTKRKTAIKYLTPELRKLLCEKSRCLRDQLLIRTGAELGLRTKENLGLVLNDFKAGHTTYKGLLSLFKEMHNDSSKISFRYWLQGKYSKSSRSSAGGRERWLLIHRALLLSLERYFITERPVSNSDTFFLTKSGNPIPKNKGTTVFRNIRNELLYLQASGELGEEGQKLEEDHTYHILRHSFGTDLFHSLAERQNTPFDAVTTTHPVYLYVAERMVTVHQGPIDRQL